MRGQPTGLLVFAAESKSHRRSNRRASKEMAVGIFLSIYFGGKVTRETDHPSTDTEEA